MLAYSCRCITLAPAVRLPLPQQRLPCTLGPAVRCYWHGKSACHSLGLAPAVWAPLRFSDSGAMLGDCAPEGDAAPAQRIMRAELPTNACMCCCAPRLPLVDVAVASQAPCARSAHLGCACALRTWASASLPCRLHGRSACKFRRSTRVWRSTSCEPAVTRAGLESRLALTT